MTSQGPDWRDVILRDLPEPYATVKATTFPSALEIIKVAAFNRRMRLSEFVGRAALAVAVYDNRGEITWQEATRLEPQLHDLRLGPGDTRRRRGKNHGPWQIEGMSE